MDFPRRRKFPESARREPPPPRRCSDGSLLSEEERNSNTSMVGDDKGLYPKCRTRPYYFRRCKRIRPTNIESLPNELLSDVLVRLPADHLYDRGRRVCRRWYHIIHSYDFVTRQTQQSTYGLLLSSPKHELWDSGHHPIFLTATQGPIEASEFSYVFRNTISNSCNGLGTEAYTYFELPYIINPATKQPFVIPPMISRNCDMINCCIAFASRSMRYKLILPYVTPQQLFIAILTIGVDNSWRNVVSEELLLSRWKNLVHTPPLVTEWMFLSLLVGDRDFAWDVWEMTPETGEWREVLPGVRLGAKKWSLQQLASAGKDQELKPLGWVKYPEVLALHFSGKSRTCIF
ncbi:hypothetical protein OROGR_030820 [Orobanche gracilis]